MNDKNKTNRWARSLDKAGILDPVNDSWELPETPDGSPMPTIIVDKRATEPPPPIDEPEVTVSSSATDSHIAKRTTNPVPAKDMPLDELRRQLYQRFDVGDFTGALNMAERLLKHDSEDQEASMYKLRSKTILMQMYEARIGSFKRIPKQSVTKDEIVWRNLDSTTAFIASYVDGTMSFEDIVDISTVSRFETCRILSRLLQDGIIE